MLNREGKVIVSCTMTDEAKRPITKMDFFEFGLTGGANSSEKRAQLLKSLNLPEHLTTNSLVTILNAILSYDEFNDICVELFHQNERS